MQTELIAISQYCTIHEIDVSFVNSLADEGLIEVTVVEGNPFISTTQLHELEIYTRWYHDMGINTEGIDVIRQLLDKVKRMQTEIDTLRNRLRIYE
ncbi:MAG TPA: chaperone modulator CbpM [Chitinophaga sp.]|nr:chaperone modulator CbpM [Chitinophaga sp.]